MDEIDMTQAREESIAHLVQRRRPEGPPPCGQCYSCGEPLAGTMRWCNADCREDWEREQRR